MKAFHHRDTERVREDERNYEHDPLTEGIIGAAIEVHRYLGPGLIESVYEEGLCRELDLTKLRYRRQVPVPLVYKDKPLAATLRLDLIVEDQVVVELKAVEKLLPIHGAQLLTYLRLTKLRTGLLFNFNCTILTADGVKRVSL